MAVAHAGLPSFRAACGGSASDQCELSPCQCGATFAAAPKPQRRVMAQYAGGGAFRATSPARRIGGLDFRTQGRAQHFIFSSNNLGLLEVCRPERFEA